MKALVVERSLPRFAASRVASAFGSGRGAGVGPLRLLDATPPEAPGADWYHLRPLLSGICGSDLATLDGRSSRYFEDIVSFPFVPGHEVVGILDEGGVDHAGRRLDPGARVVIEPVLGCTPRHIVPPCDACGTGHSGLCENVAFGTIAPGLQTGFCADTGGGWSAAGLVAHASQIHPIPDSFTDEDGVMVEPTACAVHAALTGGVVAGDTVTVIGAGALGLLTICALNRLVKPGAPSTVVVGARHPQQRLTAELLGADLVVPPDQLARAVRRQSGSLVVGGRLTGGSDVVFDCVGSAESLEQALSLVRPRGRVVLVGMPSRVSVDLTPLWHREITLVGAYAYGSERSPGGDTTSHRTFSLAIDLVGSDRLGQLVSAAYPLTRYEEALTHAGSAGRRGAVRVAFDLRHPKGPTR